MSPSPAAFPWGQPYMIQWPSDRPSYVITFNASPTVPMDLAVVEAPVAGFAGVIRLQRIFLGNPGGQTAPGLNNMQLVLTNSPGTGGIVVPTPIDPANVAFAGICRTGNTVLGNLLATVAGDFTIWTPAATAQFSPMVLEMGGQGLTYQQPACRQGQGIAFRHPGAAGATDFSGYMVFSVDPF